MSDFENLLRRAKSGDSAAVETIYQMFRPLLVKNALDFGVFDEDLYRRALSYAAFVHFEVPDINLLLSAPFFRIEYLSLKVNLVRRVFTGRKHREKLSLKVGK